MEEIHKEKKQQTAQVFGDLEEDERNGNQDIANDASTVEERARRSRKVPDRYGLPVYICLRSVKTKINSLSLSLKLLVVTFC